MSIEAHSITLDIQANPNVHDSFIACLCAILESWGQSTNYAYVAGLSGVAFSPVLDTGEDCRAWWTEGGDDIHLDFLGRALGFTIEKVTSQQHIDWDTHPEPDTLSDARRHYLCRLKRALADNHRVIVRTRPAWSVLTGWSDNIAHLPFTTVPSFEKLCADIEPPHKTDLAYILTPSDPTLLKEDAVEEALSFGAQVADGSFGGKQFKYGGALYSAIADRLDHRLFCEPCGAKSHTCAYRTFQRVVGTTQSAIEFLEQTSNVIDTHPDVRSRTVDRYRSLIATTAPYIDGKSLGAGWSDPVFHTELKENVRRMGLLHEDASKALGELTH